MPSAAVGTGCGQLVVSWSISSVKTWWSYTGPGVVRFLMGKTTGLFTAFRQFARRFSARLQQIFYLLLAELYSLSTGPIKATIKYKYLVT